MYMEDIGAEAPSLVVQHCAPKQLQLSQEKMSLGELFKQLDAWVSSGIMSTQFWKLFYKCQCGIIMTWQAFHTYECLEVIDLTQEVSSLESM